MDSEDVKMVKVDRATENVGGGLRYSVNAALRWFEFRKSPRDAAGNYTWWPFSSQNERRANSQNELRNYGGPNANVRFWGDARADRLWDGQRVTLHDITLAEWVPIQPGLYHTKDAADSRQRAARYIDFADHLGGHFTPTGKISMLEGGVGTCRLGRIEADNELQYAICATSTPWCDQGIPVIVNAELFGSIADDLRSFGSVKATVTGRAFLFGRNAFVDALSRFPSAAFYIQADSMRIGQHGDPADVSASVYITFSSREEDYPQREWLTSFCQFRPGKTSLSGGMDDAVTWFHKYVNHYGNTERIVADFDAYHSYFEKPMLPLDEQLRGVVSPSVLERLARSCRSDIIVLGDYVEGDQFRDISDSHIYNRSAYVFGPEGARTTRLGRRRD